MSKDLLLQFKTIDSTKRALVHHWLTLPHVTEWFYGQGLENTLRHLDEFLQGFSQATYWIAYDHNRPFAFLITSYVQKPHDPYSRVCKEPGEAITLDILIGELDYLGKGFALPIIQEFLLSQFPHVSEVVIDPEKTNTKAVHVYQKLGFKVVEEFTPSHSPHPHYLMRLSMKELQSARR